MQAQARPTGARRERAYAIGDIHGRVDLFDQLLGVIRADSEGRPPATTRIILLGDLIDRGPASSEMVRRAMRYTRASPRMVVLMGNHEAMMLQALEGDLRAMQAWLSFGGDATLRSWGASETVLREGSPAEIGQAARALVSEAELNWLAERPLSYRWGDYLFVHAGVKPGAPLHRQEAADLLWIGDEFLTCTDHHGAVVVHGHTINEAGPELLHNRIGIDTGAYRTGRLTALGLDGLQAWTLTT